jgi:hypothetical protein
LFHPALLAPEQSVAGKSQKMPVTVAIGFKGGASKSADAVQHVAARVHLQGKPACLRI